VIVIEKRARKMEGMSLRSLRSSPALLETCLARLALTEGLEDGVGESGGFSDVV